MIKLVQGYYGYIPPVAPVPEPATLFLFGTGMIGLMGVVRKNAYNPS